MKLFKLEFFLVDHGTGIDTVKIEFIVAHDCVAVHESTVVISEITCSYFFSYFERSCGTSLAG